MILNSKLKKHLRLRIVNSFVDLLLFIFLLMMSFTFFASITQLYNVCFIFVCFLIYFSIFNFFYYAIIPKLTGGYSLGGLLFRLKIVKLDGSNINIWEYFIRSLYAIFAYFRFFGYLRVRTNLLGQFYFDKPFGVTVVGKNKKLLLNRDKDNLEEFSYYFLTE